MKITSCLALVAAGCLALAGPAPAAESTAEANRAFEQQFGATFLDRYWRFHADDAIPAGYYAVAGQLNVPDEKLRADFSKFLKDSIAKISAVNPAKLDSAHRSDREVLENQLRQELWFISEYRAWEWDPSSYNVAEPIALILGTSYAPLEKRLRAVLSRLANVPAYYAAAQANIRNPTLEHTRLAIEQNGGILELFGDELSKQVAGSNLTPDEKALFAQRTEAARKTIGDYIAWLKAEEAQLASGGARSFRIGRELYEKKFAFEIGTGESAEALYQRAALERERVISRMEVLADELWPKYFPDTAPPESRLVRIKRLIDKLSEQHVAPAGYFDEVKGLVTQMEDFVARHDLLTLDLQKPLEVRITPAYKAGIASGSIDPPGPYDPNARTYFNVARVEAWEPARAASYLQEENRWMLPVFIIHEAIPGHYVQLAYANKSPSLIKSVFSNGAMVEGWAVYSERMMMEAGFGDDTAEQWLIYSKWYLRAVCNTILDYGVHVLGMSEDDAKRLLSLEAFQSEDQVREKWHRVTVTSVQLTSYYAGFSAIYAYREKRKRELGPHFELKRFNETFLSYGSAPVRIIESLMDEAEPPLPKAAGSN